MQHIPAVVVSAASELSEPFGVEASGLGEGTTPTELVNMGEPETFPGLTGATMDSLAGAAAATLGLIVDNEAADRGCFAGGCKDYTVRYGKYRDFKGRVRMLYCKSERIQRVRC